MAVEMQNDSTSFFFFVVFVLYHIEGESKFSRVHTSINAINKKKRGGGGEKKKKREKAEINTHAFFAVSLLARESLKAMLRTPSSSL